MHRLGGRVPARQPRREAHAVIRHHDHERAVVEPGLVQVAEEDPEHPVGVADLEEVALVPLLDEEGVVGPGAVFEAGDDPGVPDVVLARRQVAPRDVRVLRVHVVEAAQPRRRHGSHRSTDRRALCRDGLGLAAPGGDAQSSEVAPGLVHRRKAESQRVRQEDVEVHEARVRGERRQALSDRLDVGRLAEGDGTEMSERLVDAQAVAVAEQGEEVLPMVRVDRQLVLFGQLPGERRGNRVLGERVDGRRLAVEGRVVLELGEVREPLGIDVAVGAEESGRAQLVEHDEHDGDVRIDRRGLDRRLVDAEKRRDRRVEEEERREDERGRQEDREERPNGRQANVGEGCGGTPENGGDDQRRARVLGDPLRHLEQDERREPGDEQHVDDPPDALADERDQPLDREEHGGRHQQDPEREQDDVRRRRTTHREELGVLGEEVVERLRDRERRQDDDVRGGRQQLARTYACADQAAQRACSPRRSCAFRARHRRRGLSSSVSDAAFEVTAFFGG